MADITISDLELAPALADDMVLPVENTTDTYAATLAMLRRLLNKTFVEEEDADFNALTDDGFYQCTGTPTNAPEVGTINWTLQVSAESGVIVQRAFSLDDRFENFYIRRFNGVIWTAWKNMTNVVGTPFSLGDSRYFEVAPYNTSWIASNGQYNSSIIYPSMWGQLQVELSNINVGEVGTYNGYSYTKRGLPVVLSTDTITDYDWVVNQNDQTFRLPLLNGEEDIPDYEHKINNVITGTINSTGQTYTAPKSGLLYSQVNIAGENSVSVAVNGIQVESLFEGYTVNGYTTGSLTEVRKGDIIKLFVSYGSGTGTVENCWLAPYKGNGTLYYYIGDTVQDASLINAGAVLGQLANKADIDASNFNAAGNSLLSGLGMPDLITYIDLLATGDINSTVTSTAQQYVAPANGWICAGCSSAERVIIAGIQPYKATQCGSNIGVYTFLPVAKGETVSIYSGSSSTLGGCTFCYNKGEV